MASQPFDPATAYGELAPIDVKPTKAPPKYGLFDGETWDAAWKQSGAQEDWGLNQSRYMQDDLDKIWGELRKRGYALQSQTVTPASVVARNMRGRPYPRIIGAGPDTMQGREDAFWAALDAEQKKDPKFLPEYSHVRDREGLYQHALTRRQSDLASSGNTLSQATTFAGTTSSLTSGVGRGLLDPTSYVPLPGGGATTTMAMAIINTAAREATVNVLVGAAMEPFVRADAQSMGIERTAKDTAVDLGIQAIAGGVIGGIGGAIEHKLSGKAVVDEFRKTVPEDRWTPTQRAAVNVLERSDEISESSPYIRSLAGDSAHLDNTADALGRATHGEAVVSVRPARRAVGDPEAKFRAPSIETFMGRVRSVESSGNDTAAAGTSSAYGRYQFIKSTWLSYFKRRYPDSGLSDSQILAKRSDGTLQDLLMRDLTNDNARAFRNVGIEPTATDLYLAHFAGAEDAIRIREASPETPIEKVMRSASVDANPWLKGKTTGEVLAQFDRKMGGEGLGGVAPEADYDTILLQMAEQEARTDWLEDADYPQLKSEMFASPEDHARAQIEDYALRDTRSGYDVADHRGGDWSKLVDDMKAGIVSEVRGALEHHDVGTIDVKWGEPGDPERDWKGGYGLSHIIAKHEDLIDKIPQLLDEMSVVERRTERLIMASDDHRAAVALTWHDKDQKWLLTAYERAGEAPVGSSSRREPNGSGTDSTRSGEDGYISQILPKSKVAGFSDYVAARSGSQNWVVASRLTPELKERGYDHAVPPTTFARLRENWDDLVRYRRAIEAPETAPMEIGGSEERVLDESLEHDLGVLLSDPQYADMTVRLGEEGEEVRLADVIDELNADSEAYAALRACMRPGGA